MFPPQAWLGEINEYAQDDVVIMLLGNKADCAGERVIKQEDGEKLAKVTSCFAKRLQNLLRCYLYHKKMLYFSYLCLEIKHSLPCACSHVQTTISFPRVVCNCLLIKASAYPPFCIRPPSLLPPPTLLAAFAHLSKLTKEAAVC